MQICITPGIGLTYVVGLSSGYLSTVILCNELLFKIKAEAHCIMGSKWAHVTLISNYFGSFT